MPQPDNLTSEQQLLKAVMTLQQDVTQPAAVDAAEVAAAADDVFHALDHLHPEAHFDLPSELLPQGLGVLIQSLDTCLNRNDERVSQGL